MPLDLRKDRSRFADANGGVVAATEFVGPTPRENEYSRRVRDLRGEGIDLEAVEGSLAPKNRFADLGRLFTAWVFHTIHCIICGTRHKGGGEDSWGDRMRLISYI